MQVTGSAARKPAEHRALFAGNCDDHFRLGIKLTRSVLCAAKRSSALPDSCTCTRWQRTSAC